MRTWLIWLILLGIAWWPHRSAWATATTFDGATAQKVTVTSFSGIQLNVLSLGCWTYRTGDGPGSGGRILNREADSWNLMHEASTLTYAFLASCGAACFGEWTIPRPAANEWHHVAVVYDGTAAANNPTMYLDGVAQTVTQSNAPTAPAVAGVADLVIGNRPAGDRTWAGHLASCFLYNRLLSAGEVRQVMRYGPQTVRRGLVCSWPMGVFAGGGYGGDGGASCAGTEAGAVGRTTIGPPVSRPQAGGWR
jgi:hypothetical protein